MVGRYKTCSVTTCCETHVVPGVPAQYGSIDTTRGSPDAPPSPLLSLIVLNAVTAFPPVQSISWIECPICSDKMPEGPELHMASIYVHKMCSGVIFTGAVIKSEVSKSSDVPFTCEAYRITATSRGKEVKLTLTPVKSDEPARRQKAGQADQPMDIVFRFGMSGFFKFTTEDELPKHAHLRFYSSEKPCRVLSFVDARRFGSWHPGGVWQPSRGPCVLTEYKGFRENVISHLSDHAFDRPICEVLLNQKYFNGIGNYLRAEILFRTVLEGLESEDDHEKPVKHEILGVKTSNKAKQKKVKEQAADLLRLCHTVPLEVVSLGGKGYDPQKSDYSGFEAWLQCYYVDGMKSVRDHNGRTMWFKGDPGPLVPKDAKSPKAKKRVKKEEDHDYTGKKNVARGRSNAARKKLLKQESVTKSPKSEKEVPLEEVGSKRRKKEVTMTKTRSARRRKSSSSSVEPKAAVTQRKSGRLTRQSGKGIKN
ncbi:endonuclease 8-like 1 isoform X2 [Nelusetta ayraudi]|uniref:endonuclease 8-like 1 isoform X2 n=1 Tax=Nelusetta ayraudi TaxID=303726 RepID=UPI003F6FC7BB